MAFIHTSTSTFCVHFQTHGTCYHTHEHSRENCISSFCAWDSHQFQAVLFLDVTTILILKSLNLTRLYAVKLFNQNTYHHHHYYYYLSSPKFTLSFKHLTPFRWSLYIQNPMKGCIYLFRGIVT